MGFFDRLRSAFRAAPSLPAGLALQDGLLVTNAPGIRGAARRGTRELIAAYKEQPWLRAVASRIGRGVASVGWEVYARSDTPGATAQQRRLRRGPGGHFIDSGVAPSWRWAQERTVRDVRLASPDYRKRAARRRELGEAGLLREVPDHPALQVLAAPNPLMTGRSALQVTQVWLDIVGEAFWWLDLDAQGKPTGFLPIPPHWVAQCPTGPQQPNFRLSWAGLQKEIPQERMVWLRDVDPENPLARGTGVGVSLGDELETDEAAAKYLKAWFTNSAMPNFIVAFEGAQPDQLQRAKEIFEAQHRGAANAHRAFFASGKMNAQRLDASFRDQQLIDLRKMDRDTIAQVFAMPPELLGIIENSNRSTIDAARYIYVLGVEWPRAEFMRTELQLQFLSRWDPALVLEAEVEVPEDEERRLAAMQAMPGAFSLNEWRATAGAGPRAGWDDVFPPLSLPGQEGPQAEDEEDEEDGPEGISEDTEEPPEEDRARRPKHLRTVAK